MDETKSLTTCVVAAIVAIALLFMHGCYQEEQTKREAMRAGLVQKQELSTRTTVTVWTKP